MISHSGKVPQNMDWLMRAILRRLLFLIMIKMVISICILPIIYWLTVTPVPSTRGTEVVYQLLMTNYTVMMAIHQGQGILFLPMLHYRQELKRMGMAWAYLSAILIVMDGLIFMLPTIFYPMMNCG